MKSKNLVDFIARNDHKILDVIYLVDWDHDMGALHAKLKSLKKDRFAPDERIVILHLDTEYFYHDCVTGFTTHNLFSLIRSLEFPLHAFTIITSYPDYYRSIEPFVTSPHDRPEILNPLMHFFTLSVLTQLGVLDTEIRKQIRFPALALMGTERSHRVKLFQFIQQHALHNQINFNFGNPGVHLSNTTAVTNNQHPPVFDLIYSHPHRINDGWANFVDNYPDINRLNQAKVETTVNPNLTGTGLDFYNTHAIDIVTETVFDFPYAYITEKTFRSILLETPFIMLGPQGTLRHLKDHGLHTFSDYWDESYDDIADPRQRFQAVTAVIKKICDCSLPEIESMYELMRPKLQHNRKFLLQYIEEITKPLYDKLHRLASFSVPSTLV